MLIFLMVFFVGAMAFMVYNSPKTPRQQPEQTSFIIDNTPDPHGISTDEPGDESPSPLEDSPAPSPEETETPEPEPSKEGPSDSGYAKFTPPAPDGPPDLERGLGNMDTGREGKVFIIVYSKVWDGSKAYIIDKEAENYRLVDFPKTGDGEYKASLPPGDYQLRIVKNGFFAFEADLPLLEDGLAADIHDPLKKRPYLEINSTPPGALVLIDNMDAGTTPVLIRNLDAKEYTVKLIKEGYQSKQFKQKLESEKGVTKKIDLLPR